METTDGLDAGVWRQAGEQLGLQGIAIPEEYGGAGFSFAEQAIVLEELGAALYGGPYLASAVLAATALLASPDEDARKAYLPGHRLWRGHRDAGVHRGGRLVGARGDPADGRRPARTAGGSTGARASSWTGTRRASSWSSRAPGDGLSLFAVPGDASGLTRTALPTLDQTQEAGPA